MLSILDLLPCAFVVEYCELRTWNVLACFLLLLFQVERRRKMIEEMLERLAIAEFGTLDGVTLQYVVDAATGFVHYCVWRK